MLENIPLVLSIGFLLITGLSIFLFFKAANYSKITLRLLIIWLAIQTLLGVEGFFTVTDSMPPRAIFMILPPLLIIAVLFLTQRGRAYLDKLHLNDLILLHAVRIPVEVVLYFLFIYKTIPVYMTFEGWNFDIIMGITALLVYFSLKKGRKNPSKFLLVWNVLGILFLLNIVVISILCSPVPFQALAFDQSNIAVLHFPFNTLPSIVVPLVLLSHLATIRLIVNS